MQKAGMQSASDDNRSYICPKCSSSFNEFEEFNAHIKGFCKAETGKKAFCIAFKGSDCTSSLKRINFTVDDYYYGHASSTCKFKKRTISKKFSCYSCGKVLRNNLRFMSHVRHKIENEWKENDNVNDFNICNHCYRHYSSPFHLQCHIETVHATVPAATTCRICELNFENEQMFLMHMKDRHTYNEMPYICKLCNYKTSFYNDLTVHFRITHENSNSLLCPFCLAIHHTTNSYLTHVIQHMNKSVRCTQCRLQFFTAKDKANHVENDHKSVLKGDGKKSLPKNPNQYMIFVKISHHPLSPSKRNESFAKKSFQEPPQITKHTNPNMSLSKENWTISDTFDPRVPLNLRPFVRDSKLYIVLSYEALQYASTKCLECNEVLGVFVASYNKHFQKEYKCRKCPFLTRCSNRMTEHTIKNHGRPDDDEDEDKQLPSTTRKESIRSPVRDTSPESSRQSSSSSRSRTRLRSSSSSRQSSPPDDQPRCSKTNENAGGSRLDRSSDQSLTSARKSSSKKRKITDINSILLMKQQEQEMEKEQEQELERSSKQRRKQSKPQKLEVDSEKLSTPNKSKADSSSKSILPPPLDPSASGYDGISVEEEAKKRPGLSKKNQDSNPPVLFDQFANHLGLSKKTSGKVPARKKPKPFVNPRTAAFSFPNMSKNNSPSSTPANKKATSNPSFRQRAGTSKSVATCNSLPPMKKTTSATPNIMLPFGVDQKQSNVSESINRPSNLFFSDVTNSSFLVSWTRPFGTVFTEYKLIFQGVGLPTTQRLPPEQSSVRLIGLRSNTLYLVQLCAVFQSMQSVFIEGVQRTLGLRENKDKKKVTVDEVIVLDDDNDDDVIDTTPSLPNTSLSIPSSKNSKSSSTQMNRPLVNNKGGQQRVAQARKTVVNSRNLSSPASVVSKTKTTLRKIAFDPARGSIVHVSQSSNTGEQKLSSPTLSKSLTPLNSVQTKQGSKSLASCSDVNTDVICSIPSIDKTKEGRDTIINNHKQSVISENGSTITNTNITCTTPVKNVSDPKLSDKQLEEKHKNHRSLDSDDCIIINDCVNGELEAKNANISTPSEKKTDFDNTKLPVCSEIDLADAKHKSEIKNSSSNLCQIDSEKQRTKVVEAKSASDKNVTIVYNITNGEEKVKSVNSKNMKSDEIKEQDENNQKLLTSNPSTIAYKHVNGEDEINTTRIASSPNQVSDNNSIKTTKSPVTCDHLTTTNNSTSSKVLESNDFDADISEADLKLLDRSTTSTERSDEFADLTAETLESDNDSNNNKGHPKTVDHSLLPITAKNFPINGESSLTITDSCSTDSIETVSRTNLNTESFIDQSTMPRLKTNSNIPTSKETTRNKQLNVSCHVETSRAESDSNKDNDPTSKDFQITVDSSSDDSRYSTPTSDSLASCMELSKDEKKVSDDTLSDSQTEKSQGSNFTSNSTASDCLSIQDLDDILSFLEE